MESSNRQKANGTRLCRLLIDKGTEALQNVFDNLNPPASWNLTLKSYGRTKMKKLIRNLNTRQLDILYPPTGSASSSQNYDITLLFSLLRNMCGLSPPSTTASWDKEPPSNDITMEADLARVKFYRNKVYGHITTTSIPSTEFEQYWQSISDALARLGVDIGEIEKIKKAPLEEDFWCERLKQWKESEDKIDVALQSISQKLDRNQATGNCWWFFFAGILVVILVCVTFLVSSIPDSHSKNIPDVYLQNVTYSTFVGRRWLFKELEERINTSSLVRGILIVGEPGFGKSSIMKQLITSPGSSYFINKNIFAYHFCKFDETKTRNIGIFMKKIVSMFAQKVPEITEILRRDESVKKEHKNCETYPHSCFQRAFLELLRKLKKPPAIAFVIIDALDECREKNDDTHDSPILQIFHSKGAYLPSWVKFIFTSRNMTTIIGKLSEIDVSTLHLISTDKRNLLDIRSFIKKSLEANHELIQKEIELNHSIDFLSQKAQGNFLVIKTMLEIFKDNPKSLYRKNAVIPVTLGRLYALSFRERYRAGDFEQMQPMLEVLLSSGTPLKVNELQKIFTLKQNVHDANSYVKKVIKQIAPYLIHSDDGTVRFFHQSFRDWLMNQTEGVDGLFIEKPRGHHLLAEYRLNQFDNVNNKPDLKQFSELSMHILYAGMIKEHIHRVLTFNVSQILGGNVNRTILHELAKVKKSTKILEVYVHEFESVDVNDEAGSPPSFYAAQEGNIDNLKLFIENGANVNYMKSMHGVSVSPSDIESLILDISLAFISAEVGSAEITQILLSNEASFDEENIFGQKPIHIAAKYGHIELIQVLISHGATKADNIVLHHAAAGNHTDLVKYLLKNETVRDSCFSCRPGNISSCYTRRNISVNQTHLCFCETALYAAVSRGYTPIVKLLLKYGDNESLNCKHYSGKIPLMDAVERNDKSMVKLLLTYGADVHQRCTNEMYTFNDSFKLGLRYECSFANTWKKQSLYTSYCDRPVCYDGMGTVHLCARQGLWEMAKYLVSTGNADLMALDNFNLSMVDYAVIYDHADFIREFRENYPSELERLASAFGKKRTLEEIVKCGSIETLRLFYIENNNKRFSENYTDGSTLLHLATMWSPYPSPPRGLDEGSFLREVFSCTDTLNNHDCRFGRYPKGSSCFPHKMLKREYEKRLKVVKLLAKFERNVDTTDAHERTALHYAASSGFAGAVRHLVRAGSDWRIKDNKGYTPLMLALKAAPRRLDFFRMTSCQNQNDENISFQSCKSTVFDYTASYLIKLENASLNKCNELTKAILKVAVDKKLYLTMYSTFENGVNVNCTGGFKMLLLESLFSGYRIAEMNEVVKIFQLNVSERCGAPFSKSEIHLMAYFGMPSDLGNFFKPSYNNFSIPFQRLVDRHPKGVRLFDECYDNEGYLPIHRAVQGGNVDAVQWFLEMGVDMSKRTKSGMTPLDLAIRLLVPKRFGKKDGSINVINQYSRLSHFYFVSHTHHSSLYHRYSQRVVLQSDYRNDFRKHVNIVQNTREKVFNKLLEKTLAPTDLKIPSIIYLWCKKSSTELSPLHIAASLGVEILHDMYKTLQSLSNRHSFKLRCLNKHNVEPLYLAKLYDSVEAAEHQRKIFLQEDHFEELTTEHSVSLKYPDRDAEYHLIYNHFYKTPENEVFSNFDSTRLFQCKDINDFLPRADILTGKVNRCYHRCETSVLRASDLFLSIYSHISVQSLLDPFYHFEELSAHLDEIRYHALKIFYKMSSKLWRHVSKAYECSHRCHCAETKLKLLKEFTSEPRKNRKVGQFVAQRMGWSNTSLNGDVRYRWPFRFLLSKALRTDRAYDYLKNVHGAFNNWYENDSKRRWK